jgi:PDZ domain
MLTALISAGSLLRAQGPVADPYSIGAALGGQGSCPVFISSVIPDSPAQRAGIRAGDFLLAVGATKVENIGHAFDLLRSDNPGTVTVKLWRSGREIESVVGREKRSSILARTGGKSVPAFQYFLTAREAETERLLSLGGRVVGRVFSPTRYPDNPEMFHPGFEIFVLRGPGAKIKGVTATDISLVDTLDWGAFFECYRGGRRKTPCPFLRARHRRC